MNKTIQFYNKSQSKEDKKICDLLARKINQNLPEAENKIWHAHPVWFLNENPIVGYHKLKDSVRLLFWSGQSFEEKGLQKEGSFKAAEKRFTAAKEVNVKDLKRWLKKSKTIQWDYKNLIKRRGVLLKLENEKKSPIKLKDGAFCKVIAGTHEGKSGTMGDINTSKTGHITITVKQKNGVRFKTLGKNVIVQG